MTNSNKECKRKLAKKSKCMVLAAVFFVSTLMSGGALAKNDDLSFNNSMEQPLNVVAVMNPIPDIIFYNDPSKIIGKTPRILQGSGTDSKVIARLSNALKSGRKFEGKAINYKKDGTPFIMYWRVLPIKVGKKISAWVAIQREGGGHLILIVPGLRRSASIKPQAKTYRTTAGRPCASGAV